MTTITRKYDGANYFYIVTLDGEVMHHFENYLDAREYARKFGWTPHRG